MSLVEREMTPAQVAASQANGRIGNREQGKTKELEIRDSRFKTRSAERGNRPRKGSNER